jgi:hypothetical protein
MRPKYRLRSIGKVVCQWSNADQWQGDDWKLVGTALAGLHATIGFEEIPAARTYWRLPTEDLKKYIYDKGQGAARWEDTGEIRARVPP